VAYVYAVLVDGVIRYFGKGSAKGGKLSRFHDHMRAMRRMIRHAAEGLSPPSHDRHTELARNLAHEWLDGVIIAEHIIVDDLTDEEAFDREIVEIAARPKGQLWNISRGGPGFGLETHRRAGRSHVGKKHSAETRQRQAAGVKAHWADPAQKVAHSVALKGVPRSLQARANISAAQKKRFANVVPLRQ